MGLFESKPTVPRTPDVPRTPTIAPFDFTTNYRVSKRYFTGVSQGFSPLLQGIYRNLYHFTWFYRFITLKTSQPLEDAAPVSSAIHHFHMYAGSAVNMSNTNPSASQTSLPASRKRRYRRIVDSSDDDDDEN